MKNSFLAVCLTVSLLMPFTSSYAQEEVPKKAQKIFLKAEHFYNHFAYFKAIDQYKQFLSLQKNHHESMLKIASSYYKIKNYDQTLAWYDSALRYGDLPTEHEVQYAEVLLNHGKHKESKVWFKKYLESQPADKRASEKLQGLEDMGIFYRDSSLYKVSNLSINSKSSDFSLTFYKEGFIFVSAREETKRAKDLDQRSNGSYLDLYYAAVNDSSIGAPQPFSDAINSTFHEGPLALYDSGKKMIFTRSDVVKGKPNGENGSSTIHFQMFHTERNEKDEWSHPKLLNLHDKHYSMGHPSISSDGKTLYFASNIPGGYGGSDIYMSSLENDNWSKPINLGSKLNTEGNEMFPYLFNDSILYFSSDGFRGLGGLDIFKTRLQDLQDSSQVYNMGYPLNSSKDDFGITLDVNGTHGYFSSNREGGVGGDDIYKFIIRNGTHPQPVEHLEPPIEVFYTVQILALKNPKVVRKSFLQTLKGVVRHDGKDGLHRYTYGEYKGPDDALGMLKEIQDMGYKDAFIRRVERYTELSKAPGQDVELLYRSIGSVD